MAPQTADSSLTDSRFTWWLQLGVVAAGITTVCILTASVPGHLTDASHLATVDALINSGTFAIDDTVFAYTPDKIQIDGRFYSDKPPLLSLYLTGLFWSGKTLFGWAMETDLQIIYYWLTLLSSGAAFVFTLLGVYRLADRLGARPVVAAGIATAGCGATLLLPYATVINSQAAAAPFLTWFVVVLLGYFPTDAEAGEPANASDRPLNPGAAFGTGMLGGAAILLEPTTAAFILPVTVGFATIESTRHALPWLATGASALFIPHSLITFQLSGHPLLLNLDPTHFDYAGSAYRSGHLSGTGWAHDSLPDALAYAYHSILGYRGAVLYNLPAALGSAFLVRACITGRRRRICASVLVGAILFFVLTIGFTADYSGNAYGIRWHAACAPMISAFIALGLTDRSQFARQIAAIGLAVGAIVGAPVAALGTIDPWVPSSGDQYSVAEIVSGQKTYLKTHASRAIAHLEAGRYVQARNQAEHVIRRAPRKPIGWELAFQASMHLDDTERLQAYRRRLQSANVPLSEAIRRDLLRRIDKILAPPDSG